MKRREKKKGNGGNCTGNSCVIAINEYGFQNKIS
jgi:hypothetical protein